MGITGETPFYKKGLSPDPFPKNLKLKSIVARLSLGR